MMTQLVSTVGARKESILAEHRLLSKANDFDYLVAERLLSRSK